MVEKSKTKLRPTKKGAAISGSATGIALVVNWIYSKHYGEQLSPDVAIVIAGGCAFILSWASDIMVAVGEYLKRKLGGE